MLRRLLIFRLVRLAYPLDTPAANLPILGAIIGLVAAVLPRRRGSKGCQQYYEWMPAVNSTFGAVVASTSTDEVLAKVRSCKTLADATAVLNTGEMFGVSDYDVYAIVDSFPKDFQREVLDALEVALAQGRVRFDWEVARRWSVRSSTLHDGSTLLFLGGPFSAQPRKAG